MNVVVTGGSRGLGLGIAQALVKAGFTVIAIARQKSEALATAMSGANQLHFHAADLADIPALFDLAQTLHARYGTIYGLVNNAGIGTPGILSTMAASDIERLIQLNVTSPITLTKYLVRPMLAARAGRIVNISSIVASNGYSGLSVYSATKAALIGFTHALAREVGSLGITVNAVAPGFLDTTMTNDLAAPQREQIKRRSALKRMASVDDVGMAVSFLMGAGAASITGTVLTVDAGATA